MPKLQKKADEAPVGKDVSAFTGCLWDWVRVCGLVGGARVG